MKKSIIVSLTCMIIGVCHTTFGQQNALFTQYIDGQLYSNAAIAGSNDVMSIAAVHRQQWLGLQGAPMTTGLMGHAPLRYESVGVGLEFWNDRLGTLNRTTFGANFAYRFKFKGGGKLAFGIKGILDLNSSDISTLSNAEGDTRAYELQNSFVPNAGVGLLYKSPKWFVGLGVPRILKNKNPAKNGGYANDMSIYFLAGVVMKVNDKWKFRPTTQVRIAQNTPMSADVTATLIFKDAFYIGVNYRFLESIGFLAQYQITQQFKLGYAYDLSLSSPLRSTNAGSHEVVMSFDMNFTKTPIVSPRYF